MPNSRCFLIGHRDTSSDILPSLTTEIEHHIREQGITEFVVGQYGGFDRLAACPVPLQNRISRPDPHPAVRLSPGRTGCNPAPGI